MARPIFTHFQLRSMVCPISKNKVFFSNGTNSSVQLLDPESGEISDFITLRDTQHCNLKVSAMAANSEFVVAGGLGGEYVVKALCDLDTDVDNMNYSCSAGTIAGGIVTDDSNGITNHVSLISSEHATTPHAMFSSNDQTIRTLDLVRNTFTNSHNLGWTINCSDYNRQSSNMRLFVGDALEGAIMDTNSNEVTHVLSGHTDYGFACSWSPTEPLVATGNQDGTCRVYDLRNPGSALHVFKTKLGKAIRSMQFDSSGRFLVFAEEMDYISIYDVQSQFKDGQVISMWGEISGLGITDGADGIGQTITIGNFDRTVGGIFQFQRDVPGPIDNDFIF